MRGANMQTASKFVYSSRVAAFPSRVARQVVRSADAHTQFERLLIFVLCTLWAIGVVLWTLVSVVGTHHGITLNSLDMNPFSAPTSLPTLQSATVFAVRLMLGW